MWQPSQSLKRRLLKEFWYLVAGGLAFLIYTEFLGPRLMPVLEAHRIASVGPQVNVVLQPLTDLAPSTGAGATITAYGNTFEVPWKNITWQRVEHDSTIVGFASDRGIWIRSPKYKYNGTRLEAIPDDKSASGAQLHALFDDDQNKSAFDQEFTTLNLTPGQIRFFDSPRISAKQVILLFDKAIVEGEELKNGAYEFQTPSVRGFQIGNPASFSRTRLHFFDSTGNSLGELICLFGKGPSARGTQADLNRIIQTFHPLANSAATAPPSDSLAATH